MLEERDEPRSGIIGHRELGDDRLDRTGLTSLATESAPVKLAIADDQPVRAERLAIEDTRPPSQAERPVELAVKGGIPAPQVDAERLERAVHRLAEQSLG